MDYRTRRRRKAIVRRRIERVEAAAGLPVAGRKVARSARAAPVIVARRDPPSRPGLGPLPQRQASAPARLPRAKAVMVAKPAALSHLAPIKARFRAALLARAAASDRPRDRLDSPLPGAPICKERPRDNAPKGGGGSGRRRFIPWCRDAQ